MTFSSLQIEGIGPEPISVPLTIATVVVGLVVIAVVWWRRKR